MVIGIGGLGSLLVQILVGLGAKVDVVCSKEATTLAKKLKTNNFFNYEEYSDKDQMVQDIDQKTNSGKGDIKKYPLRKWGF